MNHTFLPSPPTAEAAAWSTALRSAGLSRVLRRRRAPHSRHRADLEWVPSLLMVGANALGLVLLAWIVADEAAATPREGPSATALDHLPAEEQPYSATANATTALGHTVRRAPRLTEWEGVV